MPLISEEAIRRVAEANDIVEVIGGYLPLKRAGSAFRALCPFHSEKTPSFHVNPRRQTFRCFGCGKGGGVIRFVMDYENLDFPAAVRKLAERAGVPLPEETMESRAESGRRDLLKKLHAEAAEWFHRNLLKDPAAAAARAYLQSRELGLDTAKEWRIGYAPDQWRALHDWALAKGYTREALLEAGLAKTRDDAPRGEAYDRFRDRIMFPIRSETGDVVAFSGRLLRGDPAAPKYVNSPETPIFTKGRVLFGLDRARRAILDSKTAVLIEGQIDLIRCHQVGVLNTVAPQGTAFTPEQARLLKRYAEEAVLCLDSDEAGQRAAIRAFPALIEAGLSVRVALLPPGEDPDSFIRKNGPGPFLALLDAAPEFIRFLVARLARVHDLSTTRGLSEAADAAAEAVAAASDPVLRDDLLMKAAAGLGLSSAALAKRLPKQRGPRAAQSGPGPAPGGRSAPAVKPVRPPEPVHVLCLLSFHDPGVRAWLRAEDWRGTLSRMGADPEPLGIILSAGEDGEAGALADASGNPGLSAYIASLADAAPPRNAMPLARRWWQEITIRSAIASLIAARDRIAASKEPDFAELARLAKEILDQRRALAQLPQLEFDAA